MKLKSITIENFRGLANIHLVVEANTNVIVGPNAIGKTSFLQAIRLVKGVLMPGYQSEGDEVLQTLGAITGNVRGILFDSLSGDIRKPSKISLNFSLSNNVLAAM